MKIRLPDSGRRLFKKNNLGIESCSRLRTPGAVPTDREGEGWRAACGSDGRGLICGKQFSLLP